MAGIPSFQFWAVLGISAKSSSASLSSYWQTLHLILSSAELLRAPVLRTAMDRLYASFLRQEL